MGLGRRSGLWIDPAEMPVGAAVNDIDAAMRGVPEHHNGRAGHVEFRHRIADRQLFQLGGGFSDDHRREAVDLRFALRLGRGDDVACGIDPGPFVGPLGAVTSLRRSPGDAGKSGIIAVAGPALGTVAALLCFLLAGAAAPGYSRYLLLALAYFGCFLNLINLIPVGFLDGAKVADAIPKWMNVIGLLVVAGVVLLFGNPIGLIFLVLGIFHTIGRFRKSNQMTVSAQDAASRRLGLGAAYVGILLVAAAGMSIANTTIVNSNSVPGVNQNTGSTVL